MPLLHQVWRLLAGISSSRWYSAEGSLYRGLGFRVEGLGFRA